MSAKSSTIYLTDNGRALCGEHLGASARYTGHDISGQRILPLAPEDVKEMQAMGADVRCEQCGKRPSLLVTA